jgi:hypothetical protein
MSELVAVKIGHSLCVATQQFVRCADEFWCWNVMMCLYKCSKRSVGRSVGPWLDCSPTRSPGADPLSRGLQAAALHPYNSNQLVCRQNCETWLLASSCLSVCLPACNNFAPTGRISTAFNVWIFFENLSTKFKFHQNLTRITGTLHEDCFFMIIFRSVFLRMRNVSDKSCTENQNTHFMFRKLFPKILPFMR